jgi:hypothetical protein
MRATGSSALHQGVTFFDNCSFWSNKNEEIEWREEETDRSNSKSIEIGEIGEESNINEKVFRDRYSEEKKETCVLHTSVNNDDMKEPKEAH